MIIFVSFEESDKIAMLTVPARFEYLARNFDEEGLDRYEDLADDFRKTVEGMVDEQPYEAYMNFEDAMRGFDPIIGW